jgi:hypothetical protein
VIQLALTQNSSWLVSRFCLAVVAAVSICRRVSGNQLLEVVSDSVEIKTDGPSLLAAAAAAGERGTEGRERERRDATGYKSDNV